MFAGRVQRQFQPAPWIGMEDGVIREADAKAGLGTAGRVASTSILLKSASSNCSLSAAGSGESSGSKQPVIVGTPCILVWPPFDRPAACRCVNRLSDAYRIDAERI